MGQDFISKEQHDKEIKEAIDLSIDNVLELVEHNIFKAVEDILDMDSDELKKSLGPDINKSENSDNVIDRVRYKILRLKNKQ